MSSQAISIVLSKQTSPVSPQITGLSPMLINSLLPSTMSVSAPTSQADLSQYSLSQRTIIRDMTDDQFDSAKSDYDYAVMYDNYTKSFGTFLEEMCLN